MQAAGVNRWQRERERVEGRAGRRGQLRRSPSLHCKPASWPAGRAGRRHAHTHTCPHPRPHPVRDSQARACLFVGEAGHVVLQHAQLVHVVFAHNVGAVGQHLRAARGHRVQARARRGQVGRRAGAVLLGWAHAVGASIDRRAGWAQPPLPARLPRPCCPHPHPSAHLSGLDEGGPQAREQVAQLRGAVLDSHRVLGRALQAVPPQARQEQAHLPANLAAARRQRQERGQAANGALAHQLRRVLLADGAEAHLRAGGGGEWGGEGAPRVGGHAGQAGRARKSWCARCGGSDSRRAAAAALPRPASA